MSNPRQLSVGLADPVHDAQAAFRSALDALARPGRPVSIGQPIKGMELGPAMSHLLLALTDDDTAVWWTEDPSGHAEWLRFHTGARRTLNKPEARFAVVSRAQGMPRLESFAVGSAESPEQSATLLIEVPSLDTGPALEWRGPGIKECQTVRIAGLPDDFWSQWQDNHALFPQGIDIVFTSANLALGLPRTTRVRRLERI